MNKELAKIKIVFWKIGRKIFARPVLFFLLLILIDLIAGAVLLWTCVLSPETKEQVAVQTPLMLNKDFLDRFANDWAMREESFNEAEGHNYPDIFSGQVSQVIQTAATSSPTSSQTH